MSSKNSESRTPSPRYDHEIICRIVKEGSRVLDIGCGEGDLLKLLQERRKVEGTGLEVNEEKVYECISRGLHVLHGDIDAGLADYPDQSFDYVILNETMQEIHKPALVLKETMRVGKQVIVSFPNFGHWPARFQLFFRGQAPKTLKLPFEWYEGPNIKFLTIKDFNNFCQAMRYTILEAYYFAYGHPVKFWANVRADTALFVLNGNKTT